MVTAVTETVEDVGEDLDADKWVRGPRFVQAVFKAYLRVMATAGCGRACKWVVGFTLPLAIVVRTARSEIDTALTLLHFGKDSVSYGVRNLGRDASEVLKTWDFGYEKFEMLIGVDGPAMARVHAYLEIAYALLYAAVLGVAAVVMYRAVGQAISGKDQDEKDPNAPVLRKSVQPVHRTMLRGALVFLPLLFLVDQFENVTTLVVASGHVEGWPTALEVATAAKQGLAWALGVCLAIPAIALARRRYLVSRLWRSATVVRVQAVLAAAFALICLVGPTADQSADAVRLWGEHVEYAIAGSLAAVWFSLTTAVIGSRLVQIRHKTQKDLGKPYQILAVGLLVLAAGMVVQRTIHWGPGVAVLGGIIAAVGALSWPIAGAEPTETEHLRRGEAIRRMPGVLAAVPLVVLAMLSAHAGIPDWIGKGPKPGVTLVAAVVLALAGAGVFILADRQKYIEKGDNVPPIAKGFKLVVGVGGLLFAATAVSVWTDPHRVAADLGAIYFTAAFLAGATLALGGLGVLAQKFKPPAAFTVVGFTRIPALLIVLFWAVLGTVLDRGSTVHDVRLARAQGAPTAASRVADIRRLFDAWLARNAAAMAAGVPAEELPAGATKPAVPLVFVAAHGGGIKAAAWTALVTDCVFEGGPGAAGCPSAAPAESWSRLFAMSGASGGSVGLASAVVDHLGGPAAGPNLLTRLGTDLLGPSIAWQLFAEALAVLPRVVPGADRAEILEDAWVRRWGGEAADGPCGNAAAANFLALHQAGGCARDVPALVFNGTSLTDGCRFNVSQLDGAPPYLGAGPDNPACNRSRGQPLRSPTLLATRDLADYLCPGEDLSMATAAFLSARFPFISPTGRLSSPSKREACTTTTDIFGTGGSNVHVGDGGYKDNTGTSAAMELWSALEPLVLAHNRTQPTCVVPLFVEVNTGYRQQVLARPKGALYEAIGPLMGGLAVFGSRDRAGPQDAQTDFRTKLAPDQTVFVRDGGPDPARYAGFYLNAHPGVQAPLGWSLSESARSGLPHQLSLGENDESLAEVRSWLAPGAMGCRIGPAA